MHANLSMSCELIFYFRPKIDIVFFSLSFNEDSGPKTGHGFTCTEVGWQESSQAHNLKLGSPDIRRDLSKIVVLWKKRGEELTICCHISY